ncbi:DNA binding methylated-DNA--cysteine S-methyltransferase [Macrolepiota fuliginosa MF-IS2]|uniref:Methylated-DNA--protein-cysteine methyltransferase n=1 Tax=Macrolepiota fuliginosa MF-IS2 TaxID=1400762 RepID=A0A9P5XET6_9AGAR|nr:DNA binding methylated-DNA--cysteine S-methyltransferase [Macrolepiota fuliginosa MF-IS2]
MAKNHIYFPRDASQRQIYRTKAGKKITQYQWDVYDFILRIPMGRVTTYKAISESVGGSSRSVGGALKINPFSPYIPCHRVVASNHFIGGFFGQWAGRDSRGSAEGRQMEGSQPEIQRKIALLKEEDVEVDGRGFLVGGGSLVWRPT